MQIEIRDPVLKPKLEKQLKATGASNVEDVLRRLLETQEEHDRWLVENKEAIQTKIRRGISQLERGEGIPSVIREKFAFLAVNPGAGHRRENLTDVNVKFFTVYSYLIVYQPQTKPLQIVSVLHGRRDVERILRERL